MTREPLHADAARRRAQPQFPAAHNVYTPPGAGDKTKEHS
jgi:hypothetical protein